MSEYQHYEFRSIDKKLTQEQKKTINNWSSRTEATDYSAKFTYHYGDFPKNAIKVVSQYFDAMNYMANWGSRRLIFKIPKDLANLDELVKFRTDGIAITEAKENVLIDIWMEDEEGEWNGIEDEYMMSPLFALRDSIIAGDFRSLYLLWLKFSIANAEYVEEEIEEMPPSIPVGLGNLDHLHTTLIEIFTIDSSIVEAASEYSEEMKRTDDIDYVSLIKGLSDTKKNHWLLALLENTPLLNEKFKRELRKDSELSKKTRAVPFNEIAVKTAEIKDRKTKAHQKLKEEQRLVRLAKLEKQAPELWKELEVCITMKNAKAYDEAIGKLKKLKERAEHKREIKGFEQQVKVIQKQWSRLSSFQQKIIRAGLVK